MKNTYSYDRRVGSEDLVGLVQHYVGKRPNPRSFRVLAEQQWAIEVPENSGDRLTGGTAAITTPEGDILIRKGYEDSAIHELLHATGFLPNGIGDYLNEGMTQVVAEAICKEGNIPVRSSYGDEVKFVKRYILGLTGLPLQKLARGYAQAPNKGKYLVDLIWGRHGDQFSDVDDWGQDPYKSFSRELPKTLGSEPHLVYLVDELRIKA